MRRSEREITDGKQIEKMIAETEVLRVGFYDEGEIYIVPVNYGYINENGKYTFYFHGARAGRKYELSKTSPKVGFELDCKYSVIEGASACDFSSTYQSIIGTAKLEIVEELQEKEMALNLIMKQAAGKDKWEYRDGMLKAVGVYKLSVEKMSCKGH